VTIQAQGFVLCEGKDAVKAGIDAIGKSDVNDTIKRTKGNGGFGAVAGKRPEAFALASSKKDSDTVADIGHESRLPTQLCEANQCTSRGKKGERKRSEEERKQRNLRYLFVIMMNTLRSNSRRGRKTKRA
jgi:hypothetical protein